MAKSKVSSKALQLLGQDKALLGDKVFSHLNRRISGLVGGKSKVSSKALKKGFFTLVGHFRHTPLPTAAGTGLRLV